MRTEKETTHFDLGDYSDRFEGGSAFNLTDRSIAPIPSPRLSGVSQELASIKNSLGFMDNLFVNRKINHEARIAVREGYLQLLEAKKQELITRITIGLAESKKTLLIESLEMSGTIDKDIFNLSAEFATEIFDGALAANFAAAQEESRKLDEFEKAYNAKQLTEARHKQLREATIQAADHVTSIVKDNASKIIQAHIGQIKLALELFRERVISKGF